MPVPTITSSQRRPCIVGVSTTMYLGDQASLDWRSAVRDIVAARAPLPTGPQHPLG